MSNKFLPKFIVAFGVLAIILTFLGVNYVPRISALSSANENAVDAAKYAGPDYIERHQPAVTNPLNDAGSDWVERHTPALANSLKYAGSDWVERHQPVVANPMNDAGPDWVERHQPAVANPLNYAGPDWVERHMEQTNR